MKSRPKLFTVIDHKRRGNIFKKGETEVVVATDIISRGIDIENVELVVNFGLPLEVESYIHRIGRMARSKDRGGRAILLSVPQDRPLLDETCKFMKCHINMSLVHPYRTSKLSELMMQKAGVEKNNKSHKKRCR